MHAEKASSSSSGYISGPAYTLERAQTDASEARPKVSAAVPKASAAVPKASTAVPKASTAVHTSAVTASGDRVSALRTKDGELRSKSNGESRDWLLSARRLVEAGGTFGWTQNGAEVTFRDHEGSEQHIKCHIINGLAFLDWT